MTSMRRGVLNRTMTELYLEMKNYKQKMMDKREKAKKNAAKNHCRVSVCERLQFAHTFVCDKGGSNERDRPKTRGEQAKEFTQINEL